MFCMLTLRGVDPGFEPDWVKLKTNKIGISFFSAMHAALRRKSD